MLVVNKEDIRVLTAQSLSNIFSRHTTNNQENIQNLDILIKSANSKQLKESLNQIVQNHVRLTEEIHNLFPLIEELEDLESAPDTEIVKDLPDLKENGLGVDGRSE